MNQDTQPVLRDIVLVGGGHSHVGVLRDFAMWPQPGVRLTLISVDVHSPYSGMLPGYVAGYYRFDEVHIDLARLAAFAGARFICAEVVGMARARRQVLLRGRPPIRYDLVSINIGSTPRLDQVPGAAEHAVAVKPIADFNQRWLALLERVQLHVGAMVIAVVGGGAGGVELVLAMSHRLRALVRAQGRDPGCLAFHLFTADATVLATHGRAVQRRLEAALRQSAVQLHCLAQVQRVEADRLQTRSGDWLQANEIVWVTQAGAAPWLATTGLELDEAGFVRVNDGLQSVNDARVFAAGDVASMDGQRLAKAGVFAVRMARPLARNLRRALAAQALLPYRPQRRFLALISTGGRHAVASRGALSFAGAWVWRWKDWIDRRFMRRFSEFEPMAQHAVTMTTPEPASGPASGWIQAQRLQTASAGSGAEQSAATRSGTTVTDNAGSAGAGAAHGRVVLSAQESLQAASAVAMRCGGCGAKVGASVLSRVLAALDPLAGEDVLVGLHAPDDAAIVRVPSGMAVVHSVDFFRSFVDDPYVFGQIAANHALGDIFAMGARPQSAAAIATVPPGLDDKVEDLLTQMMSGAVLVLNAAGCALVGGHTGEGSELALGFSIHGLVAASLQGVLRKGGMRAGDALILTKPIGTGTLLAAHARLAARGRWIAATLASMCQSSQQAAQILLEHGATACTDLTGFGLLGHVFEMARPSGVDVQIALAALPLLDGAQECVAQGIVSSLQQANARARHSLRDPQALATHPRYPLLFDPQTAGGLLASVPQAVVQDCLTALHAAGYPHAAIIGTVLPQRDEQPLLVLAE